MNETTTGMDAGHIRNLVQAMTEMALVLDSGGNILFANRSMTKAFGSGLKGLPAAARKAGKPGETAECHIKGRVYEVTCTEVRCEDGLYSLALYRDVTEQRRMRDELMARNEKMEEQMELALRIQRALLPGRLPETFPFSFYFGFEPCEKVGGDLYDVFDMGKGHCAFYIADVCGHGIMAAMLTVFLKQAARAYLKNEDHSPSRILAYIYEMFNELGLEDEIYITMFFGVLNLTDNTITYANAGHNCAPLLYDGNEVRELSLPSVPICRWFTRPGYRDRKVHMPAGSRLLLYTDGLPDCCEALQDPDNVKQYLYSEDSGEEIIEALLDAMHAEQNSESRRDDVAVLLLERAYDHYETHASQKG